MLQRLGKFIERREIWIAATALAVSLLIHLALKDPIFNGPDARSNFQFAVLGQDWNWWLDPSAFHNYQFPMFYGTFFALVTKLTGGSFLLVQLLQIAMGLLLAIYGWLLTRHISVPARLLTLIAIAISPSVFGLVRMNGYEILLSFLVTTSTVLLWGFGGRPTSEKLSRKYVVTSGAGLVFGLAMLTQGKVIALLPVLAWLAWKWGKVSFSLFGTFALAPVLAWSVRNHFVLERWNPFNSSSDIVMWMGNNPYTKTGEYLVNPPMPPNGESFYSGAINFILNQPEMAFTLLLRRMVRLFEPMYIYFAPNAPSLFQSFLHVVLMLTALIALGSFMLYLFGRAWVSPPQIPKVGALATIAVIFFLVHLPFATETRHLKPIVPIALAVAVPTFVLLTQRFMTKRGSFRMPQR